MANTFFVLSLFILHTITLLLVGYIFLWWIVIVLSRCRCLICDIRFIGNIKVP